MNFVRLLLKFTLALALAFSAALGLIRAQPHDVSALSTLLTPPEGCPMPCFMGIRPGVTAADDALAILQNHPWVAEADLRRFEDAIWYDYGEIFWTWSGAQPELIDAATRGTLSLFWDRGGYYSQDMGRVVVAGLYVQTNVRFHDLYSILGPTDRGNAMLSEDGVAYSAIYMDGTLPSRMGISARLGCPATLFAYVNARALLWMNINTGSNPFTPPYELNRHCPS